MKTFARFIRWKDWGPGKTTILSGVCFYLAAAYQLAFTNFASQFILFLLFAAAQSALGFVLNDWGDRKLDQDQGKANPFNDLSPKISRSNLALVIVLAFLTGLPFVNQPWFVPLWTVWAFAAAAYSLPPLRFKTRGAPGLAFSFVAQWSLPVLIAFSAFGQLGGVDLWLWMLALTLSGATLEIAHQRYDRRRDADTQANTFAVRVSQNTINRLYALAVLLDKLAVGLISGMGIKALLNLGNWWDLSIAAGTGILYLGLLALSLPAAIRALQGGNIQDPYYSEGRSFARLLHETLPNFGLPVALLLAMSLQNPAYFLLLAIFAGWRLFLGGSEVLPMIKKLFQRQLTWVILLTALISLSCSATPKIQATSTPALQPQSTAQPEIPAASPSPTPQFVEQPQADVHLQIDFNNVTGTGPSYYGVEYAWVDQAADLYLERIDRLHINTLRVQITQEIFEAVNDNADPNFSEIDFSRSVPLDFSGGTTLTYEQMFTRLMAANPNLHVQINIWLAARWNAANPNGYLGLGGAFPPLDYAEHQEFIRELARWLVETCNIPPDQLSFTFVNEPNLPDFFVGSSEELAQMAATTRTALDEISPAIQMGGLDEVNGVYQTNLFYPLRPDGCCDFWTFHTYENGVNSVLTQLLGIAQQLENNGPAWVTEFADTANGSPDAQMDFSTREAALGFAEMIGYLWDSGLDGFIHFRLSDTYTGQWAGHGLFADAQGTHANGEPYGLFPAYYVFANLYRELGDAEIVAVTGAEGLPIVAARRAEGENPRLAVWITNPGASSVSYSLTVQNFPSGENGARIQIFDSLSSDQAFTFSELEGDPLMYTFTIPAESSYLYVISPFSTAQLQQIYLPFLRQPTSPPSFNLEF